MASNTQFNIQIGDALTRNVEPLLHEIRHALLNLADNGQTSAIDLRSIPLAPGEEDKIIATLGSGEAHARLDALGPSEIVETRYPGVWLVTHYNIEDEIVSRFIEITTVPDILRSQPEDIRQAHAQLSEYLTQTDNDHSSSAEAST
jgi:hydrogenase-1 operon protein HyaF